MILRTIVAGQLETNCYLIADEKTKEAICIDPGGNVDEIMGEVEKEKLSLKYIINTHGHFDHVGGNDVLKKTTGAKFAIHEEDAAILRTVASQSAVFGLAAVSSPPPDLLLKDGDEIRVGNMALEVIHTPGHTEGGISLFLDQEKILFTGDTIFAGSIGRTDLPGGSYKGLIASIKNKILPLGDDVRILPGHGPETTVGSERKFNKFLA